MEYVANRLCISGPESEMKRFFTAVTPGTPHFTFAGLRPVPAKIASTRDYFSEELGAAAACQGM